ncbi:MAG: amidohydrolase [Chitinophagales bacterium]|nr:amidohydrolase [Chitinophagales bacterium]
MGLRVTIIQTELAWENTEANLDFFETKIQSVKDSDLIVLPETFTTGFSMNVQDLAEEMSGETLLRMKKWSEASGAVIVGSYIVRVVQRCYNRLIWMNPDGSYETYDKRHLFSLGNEHQHFKQGESRLICSVKGWKVCPMICYDLRFPVWSRNKLVSEREAEYDILVYIANWPYKRISAWDALLKARAIENQAYVVGVNRIGLDGNNIDHKGHSTIFDPNGEQLCDMEGRESVVTLELNGDLLEKTRRSLPFLKDSDEFKILP